MAEVTLEGGETGSGVVMDGNDEMFYVANGDVEFSTDGGTTYIPFPQGSKVTFTDGLTVTPRNLRPQEAVIRHMPV